MATAQDLQGIGLPAEQAIRLGWQPVSVTTSGTGQASAGGLIRGIGKKIVSATLTATHAVTLPSAAEIGDEIIVNNITANAGVLFPHVGGNLNGETTDASMVIAAQGASSSALRCVRVSATRWAVFANLVS